MSEPKRLVTSDVEIVAAVIKVLNSDPIIDDRIGEEGVEQLAQDILKHLIDRQNNDQNPS